MEVTIAPVTARITDEYGMVIPAAQVFITDIEASDKIRLQSNLEKTKLIPSREVGDLMYQADYYVDANKKAQGYPTRQLKVNEMEGGKVVAQVDRLVVDMDNPEVVRILEAPGGEVNAKLNQAVQADLRYRFRT